jgi:ribonuclease Z
VRLRGIAVDRQVRRPLFAYLGDTYASALGRSPWLFDYPVIITECTYLDDAELDRAQRVGHTVWSQLRPFVLAHPDNLFVLTHSSLRYSDWEVLAFFEREGVTNVLVWAHAESYLPEQHLDAPVPVEPVVNARVSGWVDGGDSRGAFG